jgi:hypothetical protein
MLLAKGRNHAATRQYGTTSFAQCGANSSRGGEVLARKNVGKYEQRQEMTPGGRHLFIIN